MGVTEALLFNGLGQADKGQLEEETRRNIKRDGHRGRLRTCRLTNNGFFAAKHPAGHNTGFIKSKEGEREQDCSG